MLKSILNYFGLLCYLRGKHDWIAHTDASHRICRYCPKIQEKVSGGLEGLLRK